MWKLQCCGDLVLHSFPYCTNDVYLRWVPTYPCAKQVYPMWCTKVPHCTNDVHRCTAPMYPCTVPRTQTDVPMYRGMHQCDVPKLAANLAQIASKLLAIWARLAANFGTSHWCIPRYIGTSVWVRGTVHGYIGAVHGYTRCDNFVPSWNLDSTNSHLVTQVIKVNVSKLWF